MSNKFSKVPIATTNRSTHDLSSPHITTTDFGRIDVVYHTQLVEGDDLIHHPSSYLRAAPLPQPTMGKVYMNVRAFFVPNRILCNKQSASSPFDWDLWRDHLSANTHPYVNDSDLIAKYVGGAALPASKRKDFRRLLSQLGFPAKTYNHTGGVLPSTDYNESFNAWACLAYNRIWWDWYRDSNLIDDSQRLNYIDEVGSGHTSLPHFEPRYCCYPKDYFTTCKVNPQEGASAVSIGGASGVSTILPLGQSSVMDSSHEIINPSNNISQNIQWLRQANSMQRYLERNNIAGGRVMNRYLARFGVTPDSVRLDQSEYLGGYVCPLQIGDVTSPLASDVSTSSYNNAFMSGTQSLAGQQSGKGFISGNDTITYHAKEDGTYMVLASIVPEVYYYQGVPADLKRGMQNDPTEYFTPEFENLGFEPIRRGMVAANRQDVDATGGVDNEVFGFQPRYSSYKFKLGTISGDMVLTETQAGMQGFNLFRNLMNSGGVAVGAYLTPSFTMILPEDRYDLDRIFAIRGNYAGDLDHFWGVHFGKCKITRPMSGRELPNLEKDEHSNGKEVVVDNGGVRM